MRRSSKVLSALLALSTALTPFQSALAAPASFKGVVANHNAYKLKFKNAVLASSLGVKCDGGLVGGDTDNTTALQNIQGWQSIILDCKEHGTIYYTGTWHLPDGLQILQNDDTWLESAITTPGVYPIMSTGDVLATKPSTNVKWYGWKLRFRTRTATVRAWFGWFDHFKLIDFWLDNSGGFAFLRGSDQEVAYGRMTNTYPGPGDPGLRQIGNLPKVPNLDAYMPANNWYHHLDFHSGDGSLQVCQPTALVIGKVYVPGAYSPNWSWNVGTDDILYSDSTVESYNSSAILVSEPGTFYNAATPMPDGTKGGYSTTGETWGCSHIHFARITAKGHWFITSTAGDSPLSDVLIEDSTYTSYNLTTVPVDPDPRVLTKDQPSVSALPAIAIGLASFGGFVIPTGTANTKRFTLRNVTANAYQNTLTLQGPGVSDVVVDNSTFGPNMVGNASHAASVLIDGAQRTLINNSTIWAGSNDQGILDGATLMSTGTRLVNTNITNVRNGKTGIKLNMSDKAVIQGGSMTLDTSNTTGQALSLATGAYGVGTWNAQIHGLDLSQIPLNYQETCATVQFNDVTHLVGAPDCAH